MLPLVRDVNCWDVLTSTKYSYLPIVELALLAKSFKGHLITTSARLMSSISLLETPEPERMSKHEGSDD